MDPDRSPVDLAIGPDGSWAVTVNQTSNSVSLVGLNAGRVLDEQPVGRWPVAIGWAAVDVASASEQAPRDPRFVVSCRDSGELVVLEVARGRLNLLGRIHVGQHPHGVTLDSAGRTAYVALAAAAQVAVVDLQSRTVTAHVDVGRWPRYLALSPDGARLAVGVSGDLGVSLVDVRQRKLVRTENLAALNVGHIAFAPDGRDVYFPWMIYRRTPISPSNIRQGWVLGSRIGRIDGGGDSAWQALSLDPSGQAVADPHGIALTPDARRIVVTASGTHELLVLRREGLPLLTHAHGDHIDRGLLVDRSRFFRIPLGGRPMAVRAMPDGHRVAVANYLNNSLQIVDLDERSVAAEISLGGPAEPSLARRGEAIFYDATRSLDQWYSCHSCHYEGGTNAVTMDTLNDGSSLTFKTVLPLYRLDRTAPWTWHGWQTDLQEAIRNSLTSTMQGPEPSEDDVRAMLAYFNQLEPPPNPFLLRDGGLTAAAERGREVFQSPQAGCVTCHRGPELTDGEVHDVGTGRRMDRYSGYNTPSLRSVYQKTLLLHDGRSKSFEEVLTGVHRPGEVAGSGDLSDQQLSDLIEYLKSL
ncbi:MAG: beta-propeller fold lactonase family protein [Pirellulaceae bacterium]|nr:beta-propeller fold lactonase family protein [Pirellulaceae bacterium]